MPNQDNIQISGRITDVFAHRFVIQIADGERKLADIGPKGLEAFKLEVGTEIVADASEKPSELKIHKIAVKGGKPVAIEHGKKHRPEGHGEHGHAKPAVAVKAVREAGLEPVGEPRRKPKHFEVLARKGKAYVECHVEFDGGIRKEKAVEADDTKWADELKSAA